MSGNVSVSRKLEFGKGYSIQVKVTKYGNTKAIIIEITGENEMEPANCPTHVHNEKDITPEILLGYIQDVMKKFVPSDLSANLNSEFKKIRFPVLFL